MRLIAVIGPAGVLLSSFLVACVEEPLVPARTARPATVAAFGPLPGVSDPPPPPPVVTEMVEAPPAKVDVTSAVRGSPERQGDDREQGARVVAVASQQMDRLGRILKSASEPAQRRDVESAFGDLERARERVLQDLSEIELEPAAVSRLRTLLDGDVALLQQAIQVSYAIAPPPSQGLPQPSPLPPSEAW